MAKYAKSKEPKNSDDWFIDSGCSNHMTFNKSLFSSYSPGHHSSVELGNSNKAEVAGTGSIELELSVNGSNAKCKLKDVLHVPDLGYQLLSVPTFDRSGLTTSFGSGRCRIQKDSSLLATGTMKGSLYRLDTVFSNPVAFIAADIDLWHRRMAHHPNGPLEHCS